MKYVPTEAVKLAKQKYHKGDVFTLPDLLTVPGPISKAIMEVLATNLITISMSVPVVLKD